MSSRSGPPLVAVLTVLVVTAAAVAGCGASQRRFGHVQLTPSAVTTLTAGPPTHVAVIVMENEEFSDIIGSSATPYINRLASRYALARSMFAISHPSLPNYLALTGGSTFGITSDCTDCSVGTPGLGGQLLAAHVSWKAYMEDLPRSCFAGSGASQYAKKHDPFVYYRPIASHPASCGHIVALSQLGTDERAHSLPRFVWITPNLCHDMHDCSPATGDRFLSHLVPALLATLGPRGVLFLTWDEGTSDQGCCRLASGGHVATIVAGPGARAGAQLRTPTDHYSTLQAVEDLLGLTRLRGAACPCTPSLQPLLRGRVR
ncbi:MAG: alkaline phosphatase family protein [Solirubrobacteraceae bacterium]